MLGEMNVPVPNPATARPTMATQKGVCDPSRGPHFSQPQLCIDAAIDGAGILLGAREVLALDIAAGRLVAPFPQVLETSASYYIVSCTQTADHPKIAAFRRWLIEEARRPSAEAAT